MNIVYYTSGVSGFGRLLIGASIGNALKRSNIKCNFTIVSYPVKKQLINDFRHIAVPYEHEFELSKEYFHKTVIYKKLKKLKPDILIVNHLWFILYNFIDELDCKKIYLSDQVDDGFFNISLSLKNEDLKFTDVGFNKVIAIEPFTSSIEMEQINPLIMKNPDEIMTRNDALDRLNRDGNTKLALYGLDGHPHDSENIRKKYAYLKNEGYEMIYPSNYGDDIYPFSDYYNALDFLVYGAGYSQVWEAVYFNKKAAFEPLKLRHSDQADRVKNARDFHFTENGADQLINIIKNM